MNFKTGRQEGAEKKHSDTKKNETVAEGRFEGRLKAVKLGVLWTHKVAEGRFEGRLKAC